MFRDLNLKATYSSYEDDIGADFYIPTLRTSQKYDRASAYFSAKAIASYSKGIEVFARRGNHFRLIISAELSKNDFEQIKRGYELRDSINKDLLMRLREKLSLEEERNISNFAYLISLGIIDVKVAFTEQGIFHDKFGIMEDEVGDTICFRGSNNETAAAFNCNYEAFDITCSWLASEFDYTKISKSKETFERLWNNRETNVYTCNLDGAIREEILSYSKGRIIVDKVQLEPNCFLLDFNNELNLEMKTDPNIILHNKIFKLRLKRYIDVHRSDSCVLKFNRGITYIDVKKIMTILLNDSLKRNYRFFVTERLKKYISEKEMYIQQRAQLGLSIKNRDDIVKEKYLEYKNIVDNLFERKLREKQMWDSFYMYAMKKCSNFSVPGSGKTASVLGVYAYLHYNGKVNRIVMIGPKSSFESWIDEFKACFRNEQNLSVFSIQDSIYHTTESRRHGIEFNTGNCNLLLFNYECLGPFIKELKKIISKNTLLVFDEVHKIKAIGGLRASYALEIAQSSEYTIALTGTPIPNSYMDIRNLLDVLYHNEYDDFFGFSIQQLKSPSNDDIELINKKLQPFFCRTTKQQLNVTKANQDQIIYSIANEDENKLFNILLMKYSKNKLALIIRLLQMESNPQLLLESMDLSEFADILDISEDVEQIDYADFSEEVCSLVKKIKYTKKFAECIRVSRSLISSHKKIIVWCIFRDSMNRIKTELNRVGYSASIISGEVEMDLRQEIISDFRMGKIDCLITNPHTLAESVSLHSICHDAVYFEYSYNLVHLLQSKDRIHRLGLPEGQYTQYYFLQEEYIALDNSKFSLGSKIYYRLKEKEKVMLDAIENGILEKGTTTQEDLDLIFGDLKL